MGETERPTHDDDRADVRATSASPRFATHFKVRHYEMDALGHVNNAVYLHYLEQAAYEHSAAAGFSDERTRELGGIWIVRRHEIEYLRPATAGDVLQVITWAVAFKGARAFRDYAIYRYEAARARPDTVGMGGSRVRQAAPHPGGTVRRLPRRAVGRWRGYETTPRVARRFRRPAHRRWLRKYLGHLIIRTANSTVV